jgi:FAD/FMN-containing dehydrogenase
MLTRRSFLKLAGATLVLPWGCSRIGLEPAGVLLNDIHSKLNLTRVDRVLQPRSIRDIQEAIKQASREGRAVSVAGGRHAMGGQQFGTDTLHLDMSGLRRILNFDHQSGQIEVEAGMQWPELITNSLKLQNGLAKQWGIAQKQTGADRVSIGGSLGANIHGRGLKLKPFVGDIESFTLVDANGRILPCSRTSNPDLFRVVVGGYGLFGIVYSATLRLVPRQKLERVVKIVRLDDVMPAFEQRISEGFLYGDCQFAIDPKSEDFLSKGIFSCYRPVDLATPIPEGQKEIADEQWQRMLYLAHINKTQAFETYVREYLASNGQIYWSDTHQLSYYPDDYHRSIDQKLAAPAQGSEMISELYVPRAELSSFFAEAREDFRKHNVEVIYGTIRLIERDDETFLPWARERWACTVLNLHVTHTMEGIAHAAAAFRRLIDMARKRGGSYFLTYHKWASREQVEACYPRFVEFLRLKLKHDPQERFQSDWYRHYRSMFSDVL